MKSLQQWLDEYGQSHQNPTNKRIHWTCVPLIFWSILAACAVVPVGPLNLGILLSALVAVYYLRLHWKLGLRYLLVLAPLLVLNFYLLQELGTGLLWLSLVVFALAWVGQFYGHHVEGAKPSFLKDLQFLLIGPAWVIHQLIPFSKSST
jgi:uncharacterized membrane protein YGL010W